MHQCALYAYLCYRRHALTSLGFAPGLTESLIWQARDRGVLGGQGVMMGMLMPYWSEDQVFTQVA